MPAAAYRVALVGQTSSAKYLFLPFASHQDTSLTRFRAGAPPSTDLDTLARCPPSPLLERYPPSTLKKRARSQLQRVYSLCNSCLRMESIVFPISGFPQTALHPRSLQLIFPPTFRRRKKQINGTDGVQADGLLRGTSNSNPGWSSCVAIVRTLFTIGLCLSEVRRAC